MKPRRMFLQLRSRGSVLYRGGRMAVSRWGIMGLGKKPWNSPSSPFRPAPLTPSGRPPMVRAENRRGRGARENRSGVGPMKVRNSLKSLRGRHRDNRIVRRKGRVYIINKTQRRFKARQG